MHAIDIHLLEGDWKTKYIKKGGASCIELSGPSCSLRIHIPHADARALEAVARIMGFAIRMNDGTLKLKEEEKVKPPAN